MSNNFIIGDSNVDINEPCYLKFHQFDIYNSVDWTSSGQLCWNSATKQIYVQPFPEKEILVEPIQPVNSIKKTTFKKNK